MPVPITQTKIILPRRRPDILSRQRLLNLLYELVDYRLIIVAAPAGYGKTSLLIDFSSQVELPVCWYALDDLDNDPLRFLSHFVASIEHKFPAFGEQSNAALQNSSASSEGLEPERLAANIANDVFENIREHFLIILDDYHLLNENSIIDSFINRFIQDVSENCHLVLSSRSLLTLPDLPVMVAHSLVGGLSYEELIFRSYEIQSLAEQNFNLSIPDAAAEELANETEGWITGLLLSAQTMWKGMANQLRVARVSGVGLYEYLAQQVLEEQPWEIRDFLLETACLEEFDIDLCRAVLGEEPDWPELFNAVLQANLFVLPVGEDGRWLRYHHLFRDFLQKRLEQENPHKKEQIFRRMAQVYEQRGEWERAYSASQRLRDNETLANLIERAGTQMVKSGQLLILAEWIDALPRAVFLGRPKLLSLRSVTETTQGRADRGLEMLNQAIAALGAPENHQALARALVRRATCQRYLSNYQASLADAAAVLKMVPDETSRDWQALQAEALRVTGISSFMLGQLSEAIQKLSQSKEIYSELDDRHNMGLLLMEIGLVHRHAGSYQQALTFYDQALECWREVQNTSGQAMLLNNLGVLHHLRGEYTSAAHLFEEALIHAKKNGMSRQQGYILASIGDLYSDINARQAATEVYAQASEIAARTDDRHLQFLLRLAASALARRNHKFYQAEEELQSANLLIKDSSSKYERALWKLEAGHVHLAENKFQEAVQLLDEAREYFLINGQRVESARSCLCLAAAHYGKGNLEGAKSKLECALQSASTLESQHVLVIDAQYLRLFLEAIHNDPRLAKQSTRLLDQVDKFDKCIPTLRRELRPQFSSVPFVPPKLAIQALGRSQVTLDGKPVEVPEWQNQRKVREFFFYLLAHPDGLTKEAIGLIFWQDSSSAQLKLQFKNTIYKLRAALGPDTIVFDGERYWFNRNLDYEYDVETFLKSIEYAQDAKSNQDKMNAYREAIGSYRGPYLSEIDGTWVWPEREHLWQSFISATLDLARLHLDAGQTQQTLEYCQRILNKDPCLEEAHRLAMRAYAAKGNQAAIVRQYDRCKKALLDEVNAKPSRQTQLLFESLQR
jgi:LuxR family maltose regulon positive regulatory protein